MCSDQELVGSPDCYLPTNLADYSIYNFESDDSINFNGELVIDNKIEPKWPDVDPQLHFKISACSKSATRLEITDLKHSRWRHPVPPNCVDTPLSDANVEVVISETAENTMDFQYKFNGVTLANFKESNFIYSKQFIQLEFEYDSKSALFGIGERRGSFLLDQS